MYVCQMRITDQLRVGPNVSTLKGCYTGQRFVQLASQRILHYATLKKIFAALPQSLEYETEYECDFRISNQLRSQSRRFPLLLISRGEGSRNNNNNINNLIYINIAVLCDDLGLKSRTRTQYRTPVYLKSPKFEK